MDDSEQYGPALPPGMVAGGNSDHKQGETKVIGPAIPGHLQKSTDSDDMSEEGQLIVKVEHGDNEAQDDRSVGPMVAEMAQEGDEALNTAEDFERRSKRMKDKLSIKSESGDAQVKREEWMTELPPEMGKNFGMGKRTFSKADGSADDKDRSGWTDTPNIKKEKEAKGKKRKREDDKTVSVRDQKLHQQVEEYNKNKRSESLMDMHSKLQKKKKNGAATTVETTQALASTTNTTTPTQALTVPAGQPQQQQPQQQTPGQPQQQMQQYYPLTDDIRESLDLLEHQKQSEFYSNEFNHGEFNEAKPLADLLMNPNVVTYNQQESTASQMIASSSFNSSQMIAQAYSHAQQMSSAAAYTTQVVSSSNAFPQTIPAQVSANMNVAVVNSAQNQDATAAIQQQTAAQPQTLEVNGQQVQAQAATAPGQIGAQQVQNFAEAYATQVSGDAAAVQQQQQQAGQVVTFSLAGGQNMIIASPHTQQAGQNFVIAPQGQSAGQNIVIAAPGQQAAMQAGNFIVKTEGDDLGQNIVLTQQNLQHALGQNVVLTQDGLTATAAPENVVLTTTDGQQRQQAITATRQIQPAPQQPQPQVLTQTNIPIQAGGAHIPQVSLVLPQVNSLFPQMQQPAVANVNPQAFLQLCAKMDKMITMVKESQTTLFEMNKRVERIENHIFPSPVTISQATPIRPSKPKPKTVPASTPSTTNTNAAVTKASLKAALSSYLTISEYSATDELKRSDSNSDLFIPVGTVSMVQGQEVIEAPSPSEAPETASSTVQEIPTEQELMPVVLGNMQAPAAAPAAATPNAADINVPIVDSQSGLAVTVYEEGNESQKFELGPGSSKEPNARFSNTSATPKTVILDPRFWDILVEDFQKNMSSDQIISAMAATRKPLVRSIGTSEISICSTVLKEAESACQGRRERLAKELVFRIFTLGEVYDRNVSGVFYINGKKMENKNKALDPAKMAAIHYLVMKYPPSVVDNPRLERLVWKNCVDRINDALRRIYNWIHKIVDVNSIMDKLPTDSIMMH